MKTIDTYWYSQNPIAWILLPLSWLYCFLSFLRKKLYQSGLLKSHKLPVPVVIVGNISVGGTGKTPLIIAMCELLKQQGIKPGVISRGYGGNYTGQHLVGVTDDASIVGDEPAIIARRTNCPVSIGIDRVAAAELLLKNHDCDVILSDDGLQHYRMQRDVEMVVVDVQRQFGNGFCLPAGPLRESITRKNSVDIVVYNGQTGLDNNFTLAFSTPVNLNTNETRPLEQFHDEPVHAVAGIGNPERFFQQLEQSGLAITRHPFPDHHAYTAGDLSFNDDNALVMTEKDAVKCNNFNLEHCWYIPANAKLSDHLVSNILEKIKRHLNA